MSSTHLFGEMDLDLKKSKKAIIKEASRIAELCGYHGSISESANALTLVSNDRDKVVIKFDRFENDKVVEVKRSLDDGKTWEQLDFKDKIFNVTPEVLKVYNNLINYQEWTKDLKLPMSQGMMIQMIVKRYNICALKVGYHFDHVGIETKKQFLLWRDQGSTAEFLGIINKDGSPVS